jgi:tRNA modification GTPase
LVINKKDLGISEIPEAFKQLSSVSVSTLKNEGLEKIEEHICHVFRGDRGVDTRESVVISDIRHRQAVVRAMNAVQCFLNGIGNGIAPELHALDLREALEALGEITGETTPGTILENIFSRFCIGK